MTTQIFHAGKVRNVKNMKIKYNDVRTRAILNEEGDKVESYETGSQKYVEFTVIGNNHEYQDFMFFSDFEILNPTVSIK